VKIVKYPDPILNKLAEPVETIDDNLAKIVAEMFKAMYAGNGVGLAAPQVGISKRFFIVNIDPHEQSPEKLAQNEYVFINPILTNFEGEQEYEEGCLSIPGVNAKVKRAQKVTITAQNLVNETFTLELDGFFAEVVQHENDHLDGILFIQKVSPTEQIAIKPQLNALRQKYQKEKRKKAKASAKKAKKRKIKR